MSVFLWIAWWLPSVWAHANAALPKTIACPVMAMNTVDIAAATKRHQYVDYKGRRYFFCCGACPAAFRNDPDKFAKGASIPIPKNDKG